MTADLTAPIFTNEEKARKHLEALRWPNGPFCPHCGEAENVTRMDGESHRKGLLQCNSCRGAFSVTVGSIFERSHIPLHKWLLAFHLMASSKKGISAHQLHRMLGITYKTSWFMAHRIRECMDPGATNPMGGAGEAVESDETYIGRKKGKKVRPSGSHKHVVLSLVHRKSGEVRSFHVEDLKAATIGPILAANIHKDSTLMTDTGSHYKPLSGEFAKHETVNHSAEEYVRGDAHVNTAENFFNVFKRGMTGTYQHCGEQHLQRYVNEFSFRYTNRVKLGVNDTERAARAIKGSTGKRLTYRQADKAKTVSVES